MSSTLACSAPEAAVIGLCGALTLAVTAVAAFLLVTGRQVILGKREPYR